MNKLENTYKEKLTNYKSHVSDNVWANVSISLNNDKKKFRRLLYLFFIGLFIISVLGGMYFFNKKKQAGPILKNNKINTVLHSDLKENINTSALIKDKIDLEKIIADNSELNSNGTESSIEKYSLNTSNVLVKKKNH